MSLAHNRWLIARGRSDSSEGLYLHVYDDEEGDAWSADRNRALRFGTSSDAERYGGCLQQHFHVVAVPAQLLALPGDNGEVDDDDLNELNAF